MAEVKAARYVNLVPAKKTVIGSEVTNQQSEDLGKIEDLICDLASGRIAYAVLSFGGFLGSSAWVTSISPSLGKRLDSTLRTGAPS